jgi:hypothetical protein
MLMAIIPIPSRSMRENASQMESLVSRVNSLGAKVDFWNSLILWALLLTVIAALLIVIFQRMAFVRARQLSDAQAELSRIKEESLQADLKDKDVKISQSNQLAEEANERARRFEAEAARLTSSNLSLQAAIEPRRLSDRQEKALLTLSQFAGHAVEVRSYSSDTEGLILATQILDTLVKAGLSIQDNRLTIQPAGSIVFGVSVEGTNKELVGELKRILSMNGDLTATSSIASPNRSGFSPSVTFGEFRSSIPAEAVITVGPKPIKIK